MSRGIAWGLVLSTPIYVLPAIGVLLAGPVGLIIGVLVLVALLHAATKDRIA